jgi:hypothetical protein
VKQKIGDITKSKDVRITQISTANSEQEIGTILESDRLCVLQIASHDEALRDALLSGLTIREQLVTLPESERSALVQESLVLLEGSLGHPLDTTEIERALRNVESREGMSESFRQMFRDLSAALSAVSGAITLSQLTDTTAIAIGIPAVLGIAGFLSGSKLRELYRRISERLKTMVT